MTLLTIEDLYTSFPTSRGVVKAVDHVNFEMDSGEIVGVVGESGSGKSVFAASIMGLLESPGKITDGDIRFKGESLVDKTEQEMLSIRGNELSMVFQDPMNSLNPILTIGEQIAESIRLHQDTGESVSLPAEVKRKIFGTVENTESWRRAIHILERVRIPEPESRAASFPHEFSGGMRQRAMIAMALACEPDLLIADEPTTALDVTIQAQILEELRDLQKAFETSILLISHNLAVIAEVCDRVNIMYAGEIIERADVEELFTNPMHPYTQGLLKSTPRLDDPQETLKPIPGNVPDLIDIKQACYFAPRCTEAHPTCFEVEPTFRSVGEGAHEAACLRRGAKEEEQI